MISVVVISMMTFLSACTDNADLHLDESWIRFTMNDKVLPDTIHANLNADFEVLLRTQSNNCSYPSLYKQIENGDTIDITNDSNESILGGEYFGAAYKQVRDVKVSLSEFRYRRGQKVKYTVIMGIRIPEVYTFMEKSLVIIID